MFDPKVLSTLSNRFAPSGVAEIVPARFRPEPRLKRSARYPLASPFEMTILRIIPEMLIRMTVMRAPDFRSLPSHPRISDRWDTLPR